MGVKDFNKFMESIGYSTKAKLITASKIGIDAMCLLHLLQYVKTKDRNTDAYRINRMRAPKYEPDDLLKKNLYKEDIFNTDISEDYYSLREDVYTAFKNYCYQIQQTGNIPVLIWDAPIWGQPRCEGKVNRVHTDTTFRFRDIDICYISLKLSDLGIATYYSYGDGERTCAYLQNKGDIDYIFTVDTDPLCMPCDNVCIMKHITFSAGKGINVSYLHTRRRLVKTLENLMQTEVKQNIFLFIALFLGNDYLPRKRGNGIVKLSKVLSSEDFDINDTSHFYTDDVEACIRAREFFKCKTDNYVYVNKPKAESIERIGQLQQCGISVVAVDNLEDYANEITRKGTIYYGPYVEGWIGTDKKGCVDDACKRIVTTTCYKDRLTRKLTKAGVKYF